MSADAKTTDILIAKEAIRQLEQAKKQGLEGTEINERINDLKEFVKKSESGELKPFQTPPYPINSSIYDVIDYKIPIDLAVEAALESVISSRLSWHF